MASGGAGGSGEREFYRLLVTDVPAQANREMLLRTRLQALPGEVVNVHTQGTSNAIVTLQCQQGHSLHVPPQLQYSNFGGSPLTMHKLGTEKTILVMENVPLVVAQRFAELAPAYNVVFVKTETGFHLFGLIDNIYNLRSEVDAVLLWTKVNKAPQPASTAFSNSQPPVMPNVSVAPPPGIPAHMQQVPFGSHNAPSTSSVSANVTSFNPSSPLRPSTFGGPASGISSAPGPSAHSSSHAPTAQPIGSDPSSMVGTNKDNYSTPPSSPPSSPTLPAPIVTYKPDDPPTDEQLTGASNMHTGSKSPSPSQGTSGEERNNVFTNLNPDALALLQRLSEGDIPGVEYNAREGYVRIQGEDIEEAISKFQDAYKKVAVSPGRRLRAENVAIPAARSKKEVKEQITKFEQQYLYCAFVLDEENQQVKVISQSRQFEQAKQFLSDALQQPLATSDNSTPSTPTASLVIAISKKRTLTLKKADIVQEKADILVNAANGRLCHGGGVAGALNAASQGKLQDYCDKYMEKGRKGKEIPVGEVAVTHAGGELKCLHVIHAVGPDSAKHTPNESERLVKVAIRNTLEAAEKYNVVSIALPALSCGIFGVSKDLVARSMINAIKGFTFSKTPPTLSDIRIVIIDEPTHSHFARYFQQSIQSSKRGSKKNTPPDHTSTASKPSRESAPLEAVILLNINDLPWIMTLLKPISHKWREIVTTLGVPNDYTLAVMGSCSDVKVLLNKGITKWLQQASSGATLAALARALRSSEVGEEKLASEIVKAGLQRKREIGGQKESPNGPAEVKYPSLPGAGVSATISHGMEPGGEGSGPDAASSSPKDKECPICLNVFKTPVKTKCSHVFCKGCIEEALRYDPYCPTCKKPLRSIIGKQPHGGTMTSSVLYTSVPGYEGYKTITITYTIPSGVQGPEHPNPGQPYTGTSRIAYLPDSQEGREVFQLLQKAFQARMIFTIGTSVTTGAHNTVVWNDIHHKTNISGGPQCYGYPDPTYLQRVKEDLAVKGIVLEDTVV